MAEIDPAPPYSPATLRTVLNQSASGLQLDTSANAPEVYTPTVSPRSPAPRSAFGTDQLDSLRRALEILEHGGTLPGSLESAAGKLLKVADVFLDAHHRHHNATELSAAGASGAFRGSELEGHALPAELEDTSARRAPQIHELAWQNGSLVAGGRTELGNTSVGPASLAGRSPRLQDRTAAVPLNSGKPVEVDADSPWPAPLRIFKSPDRDIIAPKPPEVSRRQELINGRAREANANGL